MRQRPRQRPTPKTTRFEWRDYLYVLLKRRRVGIASFVLVALGYSGWALTRVPMYRARALVQVDPGRSLTKDIVFRPDALGNAEFYTTQYQIFTSPVILEGVVERLSLADHAVVGLPGLEPEKARKVTAAKLIGSLRVARVRNSHIMEVASTLPDPIVAADVVNTLVEEFRGFHARTDSGLARGEGDFIRTQIEKLQAEIETKEKRLMEFSRSERVVLTDNQENDFVFKRMEGLNSELAAAEAARAAAESDYLAVRRLNPKTMLQVQNSSSVLSVQNQLQILRKRHAELSAKFKSGWPELQRIEQEVEKTEAELVAAQRAAARNVVADAKKSFDAAARRERLLRQALDENKDEFQDSQGLASDYQSIKVELDAERQTLRDLLRRRGQTDMSVDLKEKQPIGIRIVAPATVPEFAASPNARKNLMVGILLSLGVGVAIPFLMNYFDRSIWTTEDLNLGVEPMAFLGMIPRCPPLLRSGGRTPRQLSPGKLPRGALASGTSLELAARSNLPAMTQAGDGSDLATVVSERFRFLRGSILLSTPDGAPKSILVTSPDSGCGKTFVSSNLAASLVQMNKKVLLVDADLRNPQVHRVFRYRNRLGLSNLLTGQVEKDEWCVMSTETPNLFLMLAGPPTPRPGELLASHAMENALSVMTQHFDFIVLDSAPLLPVFDSHALSRAADAVVMVARCGKTTRPELNQAVDSIERAGGFVTGVVLNDVNLDDLAAAQYYGKEVYRYNGGNYADYREPVVAKQ